MKKKEILVSKLILSLQESTKVKINQAISDVFNDVDNNIGIKSNQMNTFKSNDRTTSIYMNDTVMKEFNKEVKKEGRRWIDKVAFDMELELRKQQEEEWLIAHIVINK
jgi:hypothetical protein